jgi:colanic acid/amylovoran biosynthesis protein
MDVFIGTRMHSNIFALSQSVPVIAIAYQHKTWGIAHMLGIKSWVIDIRQISSQALRDRLAALWAKRDAVRNQVRQALPAILEQARQPGAIIAADYRGLHEESKRG